MRKIFDMSLFIYVLLLNVAVLAAGCAALGIGTKSVRGMWAMIAVLAIYAMIQHRFIARLRSFHIAWADDEEE